MRCYLQPYFKLPFNAIISINANNTEINVGKYLSSAPKQMPFIFPLVQG
jgi:hypothetical protein